MSLDAIVVGAGAGGGAAAAVLAEAGRTVLLLEQGVGVRTGGPIGGRLEPLGAPVDDERAGDDPRRRRTVVGEGVHHRFLSVVGGGTLVWGMQAWRFHPQDFRMASRYGVPEGSSLADWPIDYAELEPWYTQAEHQLGVAGSETPYAARSAPYPMPPLPRSPVGDWLAAGAAGLGWETLVPPLAVNSEPQGGRGTCIRCHRCLGFTCPTDAKNGSHNTFVPRALATGLCTLRTGCQVTRLVTDGRGHVRGVDYLEDVAGRLVRRRIDAHAVLLAGGAIETARLLLLSSSQQHPKGLGNQFDQVGRNLQGHSYAIALGILPEGVGPNHGPGVDVATTAHNHDNPAVIGGGMVANDFVKTPLSLWQASLPPDVPRWGLANRQAMRDLYGRVVDVRGPVQEVPHPENRVRLDARARDRAGLPIAAVTGAVHPETLRAVEFLRGRLLRWLEASGAERTWVPVGLPNRAVSDWFHQAGTCRMSADPREGVVDPSGRVHGHDNLFVVDGSVHVTNGGFNPALTIVALALRTANQALAST